MVKRFLTALVFGLFLSSHAPAQEVFVGEQKASPKYPKAEIAKAQPAPGGARKTETATHSTTAANLKAPKSTVTKATPGVIPGQGAPAATPSPIVKPEPPLVAKTQSTTNSTTATAAAKQNVPAAAI